MADDDVHAMMNLDHDDEYARAQAFFADAIMRPEPELGIDLSGSSRRPLDAPDPRILPDPALLRSIPRRTMFVTVGATASFAALITEVLSPVFLATLQRLHFDRLIVQCGPDLELFERLRLKNGEGEGEGSFEVEIEGFGFTQEMSKYMARCSPVWTGPEEERRGMGVIVSHAGAGSMMDALRINANLVLVPNPTLMDNHQAEIAEQFEKEGYLVAGKLGHVHEAVEHIDQHGPEHWPPKPPTSSIYPEKMEDIVRALDAGECAALSASQKDAARIPRSESRTSQENIQALDSENLFGPGRKKVRSDCREYEDREVYARLFIG